MSSSASEVNSNVIIITSKRSEFPDDSFSSFHWATESGRSGGWILPGEKEKHLDLFIYRVFCTDQMINQMLGPTLSSGPGLGLLLIPKGCFPLLHLCHPLGRPRSKHRPVDGGPQTRSGAASATSCGAQRASRGRQQPGLPQRGLQ